MPDDDKLNFLERIRGKRTHDIELPNPTGKRDPRLPEPANVGEAFGRAVKGYKILKEKGIIGDRSPSGRR